MIINETFNPSSQTVASQITPVTFDGQTITLRTSDILGVGALQPDQRSNVWTGNRSRIYFASHSVIVRDTAVNVNSAIDSATTAFANTPVIVEDQKAAATSGGTFTSGAWRTRDLNTIVSDRGSLASLSSNQVTLSPGKYYVRASAPGFEVGVNQLRLRNITDGTTMLTGQNAESFSGTTVTTAHLSGEIDLAASKVIELQHQCATTKVGSGFGGQMSFTTDANVYAKIDFLRLED